MTDNENDEIQKNLDSFTRHFAGFTSDRYSEMRHCSFFDPVPDEFLIKLADVTHMITCKAGDTIISEGDVMRSFYVILFGSAAVFVKKQKVGAIISGECLGEGAFFAQDNQMRSATVAADGELILLEMTQNDIDRIDGLTRLYLNKALLLAMFKKLQVANNKIKALSSENEWLRQAQSVPSNLISYDVKSQAVI